MYAGASGAETMEATVADPGKRLSVFHDLTSLAGGGSQPPSSSVFFANRYLRIDPSEVTSRMMEHPSADGVFNGSVSFRTITESVRQARPGQAPVREIGTVTTAMEVN